MMRARAASSRRKNVSPLLHIWRAIRLAAEATYRVQFIVDTNLAKVPATIVAVVVDVFADFMPFFFLAEFGDTVGVAT
jgi:hypothetical protein